MIVDGAAVAVMLAAGLAGFWPVFGGGVFIRAAVVGLVAGAAVAYLGTRFRWLAGIVALGAVVAYLLLGTGAAVPQQGIVQVIPTLTSMKTVVFGSVHVWRQFVTATTPVGSFIGFTLVPFMMALVGAVVSFSVVWRAKRPALVLLPVAVVASGVIAFGLSRPFFPTVQALVIAVVAIVWLAWRHPGEEVSMQSSSLRTRRLAGGAALILMAGAAASLAGPPVAAALNRDVLRAHAVPPLHLQDYSSPLSSFRSLVDEQADDVLFTVTDWNNNYRLRLAVMDAYDGMVYNVSDESGASRYDRVGPNLGLNDPAPKGDPATVTVTVGTYSDVWMPTVSALGSINFTGPRGVDLANALYYNPKSDAAIDPLKLTKGDSYTLQASVQTGAPLRSTPLMNLTVPKPQAVPDSVSALAAAWTADVSTPLDRVKAVVATLHDTGYFSDGLNTEEPSLPGHSSARIADMLKNPQRMVGDGEQYAVTAALMLQSLGIPARVVMGFMSDTQSDFDGKTWNVMGSDVHAWIEVPFRDFGWVPFDPTPNENQTPSTVTNQKRTKPRPQVLQPPPAANNDDQVQANNQTDQQTPPNKKPASHINWRLIGYASGGVGIPLLVAFGPLFVMGRIKGKRRDARYRAENTSARVAGGWQEVLDRAADLGVVIPSAATRGQASDILSDRFDVPSLPNLAYDADAACFAPFMPAPPQADAYWTDVTDATSQMHNGLSLWRKYRARLSWTSLLRHPRPTVTVDGHVVDADRLIREVAQ